MKLEDIAHRNGGDFGKPTEWTGPWILDPEKLLAVLNALEEEIAGKEDSPVDH